MSIFKWYTLTRKKVVHFNPQNDTGAKVAKKKAVVMTARKLAVMMLALWKAPEAEYEPFPKKSKQALAA